MQNTSCESHIKACGSIKLVILSQIKLVLQKVANTKSPGIDGFTVEFYQFFFNDLGHFLISSFNHVVHSGKLSITQTQGVITCILKGNKPKEHLKNCCPISVLNTDYKLLSSVLAAWIKPVLSNLVSEDQKRFLNIYTVCISGNCRLAHDIMLEMEKKLRSGILLLIDF